MFTLKLRAVTGSGTMGWTTRTILLGQWDRKEPKMAKTLFNTWPDFLMALLALSQQHVFNAYNQTLWEKLSMAILKLGFHSVSALLFKVPLNTSMDTFCSWYYYHKILGFQAQLQCTCGLPFTFQIAIQMVIASWMIISGDCSWLGKQ